MGCSMKLCLAYSSVDCLSSLVSNLSAISNIFSTLFNRPKTHCKIIKSFSKQVARTEKVAYIVTVISENVKKQNNGYTSFRPI